tara:strand:- start:44402 stop:45010 length:609 start_codon:yes stop_codon:yes gene_type:complete
MSDQTLTTQLTNTSTTIVEGTFTPNEVKIPDTEALLDVDGVGIRAPSIGEGALMWELARDAGGLDLNSPYAYMMAGRHFQSTCAIAEVYGKPAGFVMAYRIPSRPDVLFIWQVAVLPDFRGLSIAKRMFDNLLAREENTGVRTMEATVTRSNKASAALFAAFAKSRNAELDVRTGFTAADFPDGHGHEAEDLYVIAPIADIT